MAEDKFSKALKAWHASPYDFDKFRHPKEVSGSGQGAAAYGRGLYVAESPEVSGPGRSQYMQEFSRHPSVGGYSAIFEDGKKVKHPGFEVLEDTSHPEWPANVARALLDSEDWPYRDRQSIIDGLDYVKKMAYDTPSAVANELNSQGALSGGYTTEDAQVFQKYLMDHGDNFKVNTIEGSSGPYSYEVAVHLKPETMLDWDETMDNHHPEAYNKIARMYDEKVGLPRKAQGQDYFGPSSGAILYRELTRLLGSDFATSEALHEAGIHGLRYLDGVSRRKWDDYIDKVAAAKPYDRIEVDKLKVIDGKTLKRPEVLKELNETIYPDNDTGFIRRPSSVEDLIRHITDYHLGFRTLDPKTAGKYIDWLNWIAENQHNLTVDTTKTRVTPKMPEKPTDLTYNYVIFHPDFVEAVSQYNIKGEKTKDFGPGVHLKSVEHDPFEGEK